MAHLIIASKDIRILDGLYSLNDLHKAAGAESKHRPNYFLNNQQTKELLAEIEIAGIPAIKAKQGIGTYVCKELVYAYAMWISPKFHLHVIRAFDQITNQQPTATNLNLDNVISDLPIGTRCLLYVDESGTHMMPIHNKSLVNIETVRHIQRDAKLLKNAVDDFRHRLMALSGEYSLEKLKQPLL
ncbi:KilA-N domain-containing protein [Marinomonas posidonica]|uniref:KilA-N domain-containing protein n=1 Tax=Marinomonas posidonica TaxID=936476 RepID=UPI003736A600